MAEYIVLGLILCAALAYIVIRTVRAIKGKNSCCSSSCSCAAAESCPLECGMKSGDSE